MSTPMGERIRSLRKEKGYTLEQLAQATGSSKSYIWELENKAPPRPSAEKLARIAEVLSTTVDALIGTRIASPDELQPEDMAFFRKYAAKSDAERAQVRRMLDAFWDDD